MHSYTGCIHGIHHGIWCILHCGGKIWDFFEMKAPVLSFQNQRMLHNWCQNKVIIRLVPIYRFSLAAHMISLFWMTFQISISDLIFNKNELMFARDKRLCLLRVPTLNVKQLWYCGSIFTSFKNIMKGWYFYKTDLMLKMFVQNTSSFHFTIFLFLHFA